MSTYELEQLCTSKIEFGNLCKSEIMNGKMVLTLRDYSRKPNWPI
jgi:hypothetical protein